MKECHSVIACAVRERGPARGNGVRKGGKERCTRQLLCPRALPRNVTQRREQLLGLRRPEGQGWHQRVHILYTLVHTPTLMNADTHVCLFPCGQKSMLHLTYTLCFSVMSALGFLQPSRVNRGREYMGRKKRFKILMKEELESPSETN